MLIETPLGIGKSSIYWSTWLYLGSVPREGPYIRVVSSKTQSIYWTFLMFSEFI